MQACVKGPFVGSCTTYDQRGALVMQAYWPPANLSRVSKPPPFMGQTWSEVEIYSPSVIPTKSEQRIYRLLMVCALGICQTIAGRSVWVVHESGNLCQVHTRIIHGEFTHHMHSTPYAGYKHNYRNTTYIPIYNTTIKKLIFSKCLIHVTCTLCALCTEDTIGSGVKFNASIQLWAQCKF